MNRRREFRIATREKRVEWNESRVRVEWTHGRGGGGGGGRARRLIVEVLCRSTVCARSFSFSPCSFLYSWLNRSSPLVNVMPARFSAATSRSFPVPVGASCVDAPSAASHNCAASLTARSSFSVRCTVEGAPRPRRDCEPADSVKVYC